MLRLCACGFLRPVAGHLPVWADRFLPRLISLFIRNIHWLTEESAQNPHWFSLHAGFAAEHRRKPDNVVSPEDIFDVRQLGFIKKILTGKRITALTKQRGQRSLSGGFNQNVRTIRLQLSGHFVADINGHRQQRRDQAGGQKNGDYRQHFAA